MTCDATTFYVASTLRVVEYGVDAVGSTPGAEHAHVENEEYDGVPLTHCCPGCGNAAGSATTAPAAMHGATAGTKTTTAVDASATTATTTTAEGPRTLLDRTWRSQFPRELV